VEESTERIIIKRIEDEMKESYLDYAMSVIVSRAIPDVRDGLKPVQRRILMAMHDLNLRSNKGYRKSSKVTGDTFGNYHPHEGGTYESLVRMAQEFSLRYPLVDGQGNFGSVDGDPPAASRYTEARMTAFSEELLRDIEKDTVDFVPNYDNTRLEPTVLPSRGPNLIVNGAPGIAVGMATNIPPQNLNEVVEGLCAIIDRPEIESLELFQIVQGPDFPTGGVIVGRSGIKEAYATGRGKVTVRAQVVFEEDADGREMIVVTEIPYQVNKSRLIQDIAHLIQNKRIEGIHIPRDESDRQGMRIVIPIKRGYDKDIALNTLYKHTHLQTSFGIIMLALVNGRPRILCLREMLDAFIDHRLEVIQRSTNFDLKKAQARAHIVQGLLTALAHLDEVIELIRSSDSPEEARNALQARYGLSLEQSKAILEMQLQRLTGLEREKLQTEFDELMVEIKRLQKILSSKEEMLEIIKTDLREISKKYGDKRRTQIVMDSAELDIEDLIADEEMLVTLSSAGYIKRMPVDLYKTQGRGGKGILAMDTKEDDFVEHMFLASTHDYVLFVTDRGRIHWLKVYEIPSGMRQSKGKAIVNLIHLQTGERVVQSIAVRDFHADRFLVMATAKGIVKKTSMDAYSNPRRDGINGMILREHDEVVGVLETDGNQELMLATAGGMCIRFKEQQVRTTGRVTGGVKGIGLADQDIVVGMVIVNEEASLLSVCEKGYGKRTSFLAYRTQYRGGRGLIDIKTIERNGKVIGICSVEEEDEVMVLTAHGKLIRVAADTVSKIGRNTGGVRVIALSEGDRATTLGLVAKTETVAK